MALKQVLAVGVRVRRIDEDARDVKLEQVVATSISNRLQSHLEHNTGRNVLTIHINADVERQVRVSCVAHAESGHGTHRTSGARSSHVLVACDRIDDVTVTI